MKIRNGFVTNSSSSSFVTVEIDNPIFADLMQKYNDVLGDKCGCNTINVVDSEVSIYADECYANVPDNLNELFDCILEILCFEDIGYSANEQAKEMQFFSAEVRNNERELIEATNSVKFSAVEVGWQGDDDSRYEIGNYDEEYLQELYEEIAADKDCDVSEVTESDFYNFVADMTSFSETTFCYSKETGESEVTSNFYVE